MVLIVSARSAPGAAPSGSFGCFRVLDSKLQAEGLCHRMNQPSLTTSDWPVSAFDLNAAKNSAASATSSTLVNLPSIVS